MFFAHGFGGYLLTRRLLIHAKGNMVANMPFGRYILWGVLCSVLPDIDLLYFYTLDNRQNPHHTYWTHMPLFWLFASSVLYSVGHGFFRKPVGLYAAILLAATLLHLLLDTVAGGIFWLYPWSDYKFQWFVIRARYDWWVFNYVFHWTMLMEVGLVALAIYIYWRDKIRLQKYSATTEEDS